MVANSLQFLRSCTSCTDVVYAIIEMYCNCVTSEVKFTEF